MNPPHRRQKPNHESRFRTYLHVYFNVNIAPQEDDCFFVGNYILGMSHEIILHNGSHGGNNDHETKKE